MAKIPNFRASGEALDRFLNASRNYGILVPRENIGFTNPPAECDRFYVGNGFLYGLLPNQPYGSDAGWILVISNIPENLGEEPTFDARWVSRKK